MFTSDTIHPISDFNRKPTEYIKRLKETGLPEVLTVNGKAEIVMQNVQAYEETMSLLHSLKRIAKAKKAHDDGCVLPAKEGFEELKVRLREKYPNAAF